MSEEKLNTTQNLKVVRQKKNDRKYVINIVVILAITFGYTIFSLWGDFNSVVSVFASSQPDYRMLAIIAVLIAAKFLIEGLVLYIFARLYTPTYKYHRGVANSLVGQFYSDITPSSSGGQFSKLKPLQAKVYQFRLPLRFL